jgi:hypothetical protein
MGIQNFVLNTFKELRVERPARKKTPADLQAMLEASMLKVEQRLMAAPDTPKNRDQIRHIVGIERWGQGRLRAALGQPLVMDEMNQYLPSDSLPWNELTASFSATRKETLELTRKVIKEGALSKVVPHNQFGDLSVRGWLMYIDTHARFESWRVR